MIEDSALSLMKKASVNLDLSGRGIVRCLRLARTIADMEASNHVMPAHIAEALSFRKADDKNG
jgi:magnesium chelatase family protein